MGVLSSNVQDCVCAFLTEREAAEHFALNRIYIYLAEKNELMIQSQFWS